MRRPFPLREWLGLIAGVCWGLVLSRFFAADDTTGPWLVILFGPPVVLLISPARPLLSWQLPIVTAAVAATFMNRTTPPSERSPKRRQGGFSARCFPGRGV